MDRRTVLKGGLVLAVTSHAAASSLELQSVSASLDEFLNMATPAEVIRYHTNALMEALAAAHPDKAWAAFTELNLSKVFVVGKDRA